MRLLARFLARVRDLHECVRANVRKPARTLYPSSPPSPRSSGFIIVNYTASRRSFLRILHDSSEPVYIAFFTLTGMTLQLDALLPNLPTAALIFSLRFAGIAIGSYWGGRWGGARPEHYNRYWMAFITQAGVALGLAQRIARPVASSLDRHLLSVSPLKSW